MLEAVLRDDPDNVAAHETMGLLRYRDGDIAGAKKWYGEAVELDPHSYLAAYHYAVMMSRDGNKDEDEAIESSLRASIGLNPEFAPAYDALAMFYASRHQRLDEAHTLNVRAVELEPARLGYRLDCADVLTEKRQYAEALDALRDAMKVARTRDEFASVERRMERLEKVQTALAVAFNRVGN